MRQPWYDSFHFKVKRSDPQHEAHKRLATRLAGIIMLLAWIPLHPRYGIILTIGLIAYVALRLVIGHRTGRGVQNR